MKKQETKNISNIRNHFIKVMMASDLSLAQKCVGMCLAHHMFNDTGLCNPSIKTLQQSAGISRPTVIKSLAALEGLGLIARTREGHGDSYSYTLHPDVDLDAVDNRNKHQGNTDNLQPSYSPTPVELENAEDDFEVEDVTPTAVVVPQNHRQPRAEYLSRHDGVANPSQVLTDDWDF